MARRRALAVLALVLVLVGCGGSGSSNDTQQQTSEPRGDITSDAPTADKSSGSTKLLKTGYGQDGEYVWVTSLVENTSENNVGEFATVQFNLYDKAGEIINSTEQVEMLTRVGEKRAIGTQVDLENNERAAKVVATLSVSDNGGGPSVSDLEIKTSKPKVVKSQYGGTEARYEVYNPTEKALKMVRIGVICYDAKGRVNGGGSDYPDLIPPSGKVLQQTHVITSGKIGRCEAYAAPGE